jgi:hydroxymethylpyrimidine pyrophosphatase-like HAD family hydrolase
MNKDKAFLILTDLDGTFLPVNNKTMEKFVSLVKEICKNENIHVKVCPITGRPQQFASGVMHTIKGYFEKEGLKDVLEIGGAEQGGVLFDHEYAYKAKILARPDSDILISNLKKVLFQSDFGKYFEHEPGTRVIETFNLNDKYTKIWSEEKIDHVVNSTKSFLEETFKGEVQVTPWNHFIEVTPKEVGKDVAVNEIFHHYQKKYDTVGMTYSGDALNDLKAIKFLTKFSEVPGINSFVFLPSNAMDALKNPQIEAWKDRLGEKSNGRIIDVESKKYFDGVLEGIEKKYKEGKLLGTGSSISQTTDDIVLFTKKKNRDFLSKMDAFKKGNQKGKRRGLDLL